MNNLLVLVLLCGYSLEKLQITLAPQRKKKRTKKRTKQTNKTNIFCLGFLATYWKQTLLLLLFFLAKLYISYT